MKLKKDNGSWAIIDFRYERFPTFCFLCGILGHGDNFCPRWFKGSGNDKEPAESAAGGMASGEASSKLPEVVVVEQKRKRVDDDKAEISNVMIDYYKNPFTAKGGDM
nr:uncharacterized protein LOC109184755 [Ipomoea batatas]